jgi:hypothetical protein
VARYLGQKRAGAGIRVTLLQLGIGGVVRSTAGTMDQQTVHLALIRVQQYNAAIPAGEID